MLLINFVECAVGFFLGMLSSQTLSGLTSTCSGELCQGQLSSLEQFESDLALEQHCHESWVLVFHSKEAVSTWLKILPSEHQVTP